MEFGRQVGVEHRAKIDPKTHRKSDEKKEGRQDGKKVAPRPGDPFWQLPAGVWEGG